VSYIKNQHITRRKLRKSVMYAFAAAVLLLQAALSQAPLKAWAAPNGAGFVPPPQINPGYYPSVPPLNTPPVTQPVSAPAPLPPGFPQFLPQPEPEDVVNAPEPALLPKPPSFLPQPMPESVPNTLPLPELAIVEGLPPVAEDESDLRQPDVSRADGTVLRLEINDKAVSFDGQQPIMQDGAAFIPVSEVFKKLGFSSVWNDKLRASTYKKGNTVVVVTENSSFFIINGRSEKLHSNENISAQVINGRLMAPFGEILESIGGTAYMDGDNVIHVFLTL